MSLGGGGWHLFFPSLAVSTIYSLPLEDGYLFLSYMFGHWDVQISPDIAKGPVVDGVAIEVAVWVRVWWVVLESPIKVSP